MQIKFDYKTIQPATIHAVAFYSLCFFWASLTFSKALMEISFVFALIFWIFWRFRTVSSLASLMPKSLWISFAGFFLLNVLSYFWSEDPKASFRGIFKALESAFLFIMVLDVFDTRKRLRFFEKVFMGVMAFTVINGLWQYFMGKDLLRGFVAEASHAGVRVTAAFHSYGKLAAFLIITIPFLASLWHYRTRHSLLLGLWKILYVLTLAGSLAILFFTRSRGAFVAFFAGLIFYLLWQRRWIMLLVLAMLTGTALLALPKTMVLHLDADLKEQSLVERYYLWDRALNVIKAKPLTGTGINTYASSHAKYDKTQNWRVRDYYAHNGYLQLAAETGLPSLGLLLFFFLRYFYLSFKQIEILPIFRQRDKLGGLLIGLLNFLVFVLVDTIFHNPQTVLIFWYFLALQWAYQRVYWEGEDS